MIGFGYKLCSAIRSYLIASSYFSFFFLAPVCNALSLLNSSVCWNHKNFFLKGAAHVSTRDIVVVGDIHGNFRGLLEVLFHSGITDSSASCQWRSQLSSMLLIQTGDVVDRGEQSFEAWQCLRHLQRTASNGCAVKRLIGNHELLWLTGDYRYSSANFDTLSIRSNIVADAINQILDGSLLGAFSTDFNDIPILFTHAGLRVKMFDNLVTRSTKGSVGSVVSAVSSQLSNFINEKVRAATASSCTNSSSQSQLNAEGLLLKCSFNNYLLFDAGPERGGRGIGGPFWTDFSVLEKEDFISRYSPALPFLQIVGHTIQNRRVKVSSNFSAICVDVGMYMGGRAYLRMFSNRGSIIANEKKGDIWHERDLTDAMCRQDS
jgi:hypothetical protein